MIKDLSLEFDNVDGDYKVYAIDASDDFEIGYIGRLVFDENQQAWVFWAAESDDGVSYETSLNDSKTELTDEMMDYFTTDKGQRWIKNQLN